MNRKPSPRLAAVLFTVTLLAALLPAQSYPSLVIDDESSQPVLEFDLGNPTGTGEGARRAMLVCYVDIIGDSGGLAVLIKKSLGAVSTYQSPPTTDLTSFVVPGAEIVAGGLPVNEVYTVPPSVIAHALAEIEWASLGGYAKTFGAPMTWDATGMTGANGLPWGSFTHGTSTTMFDIEGLVRACLARQIHYASGLAIDHVTVLSQVEAIVSTCRTEAQDIALNAVVVELQNGDVNDPPTPLRIKLSRKRRVTLQIPGAGGTTNGAYGGFYHFNYIYPVHQGSTLKAELFAQPEVGPYEFFLPTAAGYIAVPATLHSLTPPGYTDAIFWLEATVPAGVITGPFACWNLSTSQYLTMQGLSGATTSCHVFHSPHSVAFVPFDLP